MSRERSNCSMLATESKQDAQTIWQDEAQEFGSYMSESKALSVAVRVCV